ncbi:hypothetical protein, partial [Thiohalocapsa sp.]|uniref:hypothetical protein n=1 Tax=Thiohalocapsa sp. TaxID=2497641 RepID=UPI0025E235BC
MNTNRTLALALAGPGLLPILAGPLLPGGERAAVNDPPRTGPLPDPDRPAAGPTLAPPPTRGPSRPPHRHRARP